MPEAQKGKKEKDTQKMKWKKQRTYGYAASNITSPGCKVNRGSARIRILRYS
jgi:hypothetical protein